LVRQEAYRPSSFPPRCARSKRRRRHLRPSAAAAQLNSLRLGEEHTVRTAAHPICWLASCVCECDSELELLLLQYNDPGKMLARLSVMRGWRLASLVRIAADPGTRDLAAFGSCRRRERVDGTPPAPWPGPRPCRNSMEESYSSGRLQRVFLLLQSSVV